MARSTRTRPVAGQRARARAPGGPDAAGQAGDTPRDTHGDTNGDTQGAAVPERDPQAAPSTVVIGPAEASSEADPLVRAHEVPAMPAATSKRWSGPALALLAGLLALTLAGLVALGVVAYRVHAADQVEAARGQAQAVAVDHVVDLLSYDYRHLDKDFTRASAALTGKFKGDYAETTSKVVQPTAKQYQAVVRAEVAASSVVSGGADRVVVLLFVNQTTTSTRLDGPKVDLTRVLLTMDQVDGQWLVSDVRAL
jgi:Mce-associated membrane protein